MISPLLTDLYQLTMAYGYWKLNMHDREAVFQIIFRKNPFKGNYAVACGLASAIDFIQNWRISADDVRYLASLKSANQEPLFPEAFLTYLSELKITCDVDAIPEGTVVFAHEPLIRITGPLLQGQLLESTLLNLINFQTLIATKASRVCQAAQGEPVLEFGLRRAQGPDGALSASRAAYIGGCAGTSNVLAGQLFNIPVAGTHGHSWVTAFPNEKAAFAAYAEVMPNNCTLLVDTYDTLQGVSNAIETGRTLRENGYDLLGIRLDSGDLADLSIKARQMLDDAGFSQTKIVASNSLDEYYVEHLKQSQSQISIWGVGTSLVTAYDYPALDGVYKLSALCDESGQWEYKLKMSNSPEKVSNPGRHQVRRFFVDDQAVMDVIYDLDLGIAESPTMVSLEKPFEEDKLSDFDAAVDLLQPIFKKGQLVAKSESIQAIRERSIQEVTQFVTHQKQLTYPVGLEKNLSQLKQKMILS